MLIDSNALPVVELVEFDIDGLSDKTYENVHKKIQRDETRSLFTVANILSLFIYRENRILKLQGKNDSDAINQDSH